MRFKNHIGIEVLRLSNTLISGFPIDDLSGKDQVDLVISVVPSAAGGHSVDVGLARQGMGFRAEHLGVVSLRFRSSDVCGSGTALDSSRAAMVVPHRWICWPEGSQATDSDWIGHHLFVFPEGYSE